MMEYSLFGLGSFGMVVGIIFWVLIVYLIYLLIRNVTTNKEEAALEILKRRYARGEITKKEFGQMKREL